MLAKLVAGICVAMVLTSKTKPCDLSTCSTEFARTSTAFAIIALSVFSTLLLFATATLLDEYRLIVRTTRSLAPTPAAG